MKNARLFAIIGISAYVFNSIILSTIILDYWTLGDSLKWFTPLGAILDGEYMDGSQRFIEIFGGLINIALVATLVLLLMAKDKGGSTPAGQPMQFGTVQAQQTPPPPPAD